jgi:hypothetical protein
MRDQDFPETTSEQQFGNLAIPQLSHNYLLKCTKARKLLCGATSVGICLGLEVQDRNLT